MNSLLRKQFIDALAKALVATLENAQGEGDAESLSAPSSEKDGR